MIQLRCWYFFDKVVTGGCGYACRRPNTILLSFRPMHADPAPLFPGVYGHLVYWMRVEEDEAKPVETEEPAVPEPGT